MKKIYKVFISSTIKDLKNERQELIKTLLDLDCFPSGMELFPASDQKQFEFIKKVIDDCDYYLLILGGMYGSISPSGVSYTELEYEYAISKELHVLAFIHEDPSELPAKHYEQDSDKLIKLNAFKERSKNSRIVDFWRDSIDLSAKVSKSLSHAMKHFPARGWTRLDLFEDDNLIKTNKRLSEENELLRLQINQLSSIEDNLIKFNDLSHGSETYELQYNFQQYTDGNSDKIVISDSYKITWDELFRTLGTSMMVPVEPRMLLNNLSKHLYKCVEEDIKSEYSEVKSVNFNIENSSFNQIMIQFRALGYAFMNGYKWQLTKRGDLHLLNILAIRKKNNLNTNNI